MSVENSDALIYRLSVKRVLITRPKLWKNLCKTHVENQNLQN